jgi:hypothetical protein
MPEQNGSTTPNVPEIACENPATAKQSCAAIYGHRHIFHDLTGVTKFSCILFCDGISNERHDRMRD